MFLRSALSPSRDEGHLRGGDETAYENRSEFIIQRGDNQAGGHGRLTRDSRAKRSCRAYSDMLKPASRFGDKVRVGKGCKRGLGYARTERRGQYDIGSQGFS